MIIDLTHYGKKIEKLLSLITHVEQESSLNDGIILMSLSEIKDYLSSVELLVSKLKSKKIDIDLCNGILSESEGTKLKLIKLYEPNVIKFKNIREKFVKIANAYSDIKLDKNITEKEGIYFNALKDLIIALCSNFDNSELTIKDLNKIKELSKQFSNINFSNISSKDKENFLAIRDELLSIGDRYHHHYLEISELSKMQPSLIIGAEDSIDNYIQELLQEQSGAQKNLNSKPSSK